jgi:hypothetical protein
VRAALDAGGPDEYQETYQKADKWARDLMDDDGGNLIYASGWVEIVLLMGSKHAPVGFDVKASMEKADLTRVDDGKFVDFLRESEA